MPSSPMQVLVVGGGFAAAEALLALRAYAGDRVAVTIVTPDPWLVYRPAATVAATTGQSVRSYDLGALADDVAATLRFGAVEAVAPGARRVRLPTGETLHYDALLLAVGARARAGVPGATTFRDHRDAARVAATFEDLRAGRIRRLTLVAPAGVTWTLPLYELALQAAREVETRRLACDVTVVTPESAPLGVLGRAASAAVARLLADHDVRVVRDACAHVVARDGLRLRGGGIVAADRVIAAPALTGRRVAGIPAHDFGGFVKTGPDGSVEGLDRVWAAGDMTTCAIKQGGVATQQADAAAADIAELAGAPVWRMREPIVVRARVAGGAAPLYLRAELDLDGDGVTSSESALDEPLWWPDAKVFGRHLTPWLAGQGAGGQDPGRVHRRRMTRTRPSRAPDRPGLPALRA